MPWLKDEQKTVIHTIRQDYALAVAETKNNPGPDADALLQEVVERRARAIRSAYRNAKIPYRHLSGLFRCPRQVVRDALNEGEQQ